MNSIKYSIVSVLIIATLFSCLPPQQEKKSTLRGKHNYIILLDLSDRLIVQDDQPSRDKEIINFIYNQFETRVRNNLYVRSRDEIKVVIAPQRGAGLQHEIYEDRLYIKVEGIPAALRHKEEDKRKEEFAANLDTLYEQAVYSSEPTDYYGADIWKYFYEDLKVDYSTDTLTKNFLFILTDGYPIVGKDLTKLQPVKESYPDLKVVLVEAAPRDKDMEWDRIQELWQQWFDDMNIRDYTFVKRKAITKEKDEIETILAGP